MPPICNFTMIIYGSEKSIRKWKTLMKDCKRKNYFHDIYEKDMTSLKQIDKNLYRAEFEGSCANSVIYCCTNHNNNKDLLAYNSKKLNVKIEFWSKSFDGGFCEHGIYDCGKQIFNDFYEYECWHWNKDICPLYEDYKKMNKDAPPENDFDDYGYAEWYGECEKEKVYKFELDSGY